MGRKKARTDSAEGQDDGQADASGAGLPHAVMQMPVSGMQYLPLGMPPGMQLPGMQRPPGVGMQQIQQHPARPSGPGTQAQQAANPDQAQKDLYEQQAAMRYQQVALMYEAEKNSAILPEVMELAEHFSFDDNVTRALDDEMKRRKATFDNDMQSLWVGLEGAKNPAGLLQLKLKDMRMGTYKGMTVLNAKVTQFAKEQKLDAQAAFKLGEVMERRENAEEDMRKLGKHLERSNRPSSLIMMMLKDLRDGKPVKDCEFAAAVGSKVHEKEIKKARSKSRQRPRSRERDGRDRDGGRYKSRSRRR